MLSHQNHKHLSAILLIASTGCFIAGANSLPTNKTQKPKTEKITVTDPRPIASPMETLERKFGIIVTYEDAPYMYVKDMVDETAPAYKSTHPNGLRALVPRGGTIDLSYHELSSSNKTQEMKGLIQRVLDIHAAKDNPGRFQAKQEGNIFHIIPSQVRNSSGKFIKTESILDINLSFPEQQRTVFDTIKLIVKMVSQAKGTKVIIGAAPLTLLNNTFSHQGATNENARKALVRALANSGNKLSWQIFYDPGMKLYAVNIHVVNS